MAVREHIADDFVALVERFIRLRPGLAFPDEHVAALKRQLKALKDSGSDSPEDRMFLFRTMAILTRRQTPPTMGELSTELGIPLSSATRLADTLVRAKFVERRDDPHDRRVVRLCLTRSGLQFIRAGVDFMRERIQRLLDRFSPEEQAELLRLMSKLIDSIESED